MRVVKDRRLLEPDPIYKDFCFVIILKKCDGMLRN
jgi:hypothetical protein